MGAKVDALIHNAIADKGTTKVDVGQGAPRGCRHLRAAVTIATGHVFRSRKNKRR